MAKNKTKDLLAELARNLEGNHASLLPAASLPSEEVPPAPKSTAAPLPEKSSSRRVKHSAFWLFEEDRTIFHEISVHLYAQGIKPTNNLILRAAIRLLPDTETLAATIRELIAADGRTTRYKQAP